MDKIKVLFVSKIEYRPTNFTTYDRDYAVYAYKCLFIQYYTIRIYITINKIQNIWYATKPPPPQPQPVNFILKSLHTFFL